MRDSHSYAATLDSPVGPVYVEWRDGRLVSVQLGMSGESGQHLPPDFRALIKDLEGYLSGQRISFSFPVDLDNHPPFIQKALRECATIPFGEWRSYGELAYAVGSPGAARAVGQAMSRNPIPIVIPCHRVLTAEGRLGGFGAGLDWKRFLLKLEGIPWK